MAAARIQDYAAIGDCRTAALVASDGSIDWLCWPRFDSPSIFGGMVGDGAGSFRVSGAGFGRAERRYEPGTNVLVTDFHMSGGVLRLTDWMPIEDESAGPRPEHALTRLVECLGGEAQVEVHFDPRPDYGLGQVRLRDEDVLGWRVRAGKGLLIFRSPIPLLPAPEGGLVARRRLKAGQSLTFSLVYSLEAPAVLPPLGDPAREALRRSIDAWRSWLAETKYQGAHRELVLRSALALKLLAFSPSGAIVAAPSTSLPERPGGDLNWDYRFCWLRDASLTARALFGLGFMSEARAFVSWLLHATRLTRPRLRVLYDVFGRDAPRERVLPLSGFGGARPVRVGNAAQDQLQLDVYGEVVDATAQFVRRGGRLDRETARALVDFARFVCDHWADPDEGIWEFRSGARAHTHSRALCWAALDRIVELHRHGHLPRAPIDRIRRERARLRREIEERSWSDGVSSYVAIPGGGRTDASLLLLPLYGFEPATSPRMAATWRQVRSELDAGDGLLYRYRSPESAGEGAFGACGFWAAQFLAEGGGTLVEAEELFARLAARANDVGLFAEELDPSTGDALGNFPQAFTHVGLVNAALAIEARRARILERERGVPRPHEPACPEVYL